ncbi:MAG: VOC family protein [Acidobacteriota bacterium]|nr:VOC family protein [Acidobacteriota bacterium]
MKNFGRQISIVILTAIATVGLYPARTESNAGETQTKSTKESKMELGEFSISLAVKNLKTSQAFYEKLGFQRIDGNKEGSPMPAGQDWAILKNGHAKIGLFQGMFEGNVITFNPKDIRVIKSEAEKHGVKLELQNMFGPLTETSPAFATLKDPDGNSILIDQLPSQAK